MTDTVALEQGARLSESLLWRLQRRYFEQQGVQAWAEGVVPHYITSNVWIANAYAKVVFGWLRDCAGTASREPASFPPLDLRHPVHIVELGCGSGRFGYLFLNRLLDLLGRSALSHLPVRYVFSDFTESNLDHLQAHPSLQPFLAEGWVDFARFDAGEDAEIRLSHSGEVLSSQTLRNPLAVIANYVFDSIPQDAFRIRDGKLFELLPVLALPEEEKNLDDPELIQKVQVSWEERPAVGDYYGDPELDAILREYAERLDGTSILFPRAAVRCLSNLARLADGRLLLLSGDKGISRGEMLAGRTEPGLALHGSFSMMVNYHALGRWLAHRGGEMLSTSHFYTSLTVVAGLLGTPPGGLLETRLAFDDFVERLGPDDFFDLKKARDNEYENLTLEQILSWLRFCGWDANTFFGCFPTLMKHAESAADVLRAEVFRMVHEVWKTYFPIREPRDLAFHLGVVLCEIQCYQEALPFFHESLAAYGPNPATLFNVALCQYQTGDVEAARVNVEESLKGAPDFEPAQALREELAGSAGILPAD